MPPVLASLEGKNEQQEQLIKEEIKIKANHLTKQSGCNILDRWMDGWMDEWMNGWMCMQAGWKIDGWVIGL